ncbi:cubilin-like protein [Dinothrombium tinctorium]|uniref:Cubilin-like protein n=1 Tax=Dinothrombium tinctorium TaxID=1965070 RepID=A0A443RDT1_9ACAR|nr:cubilin-like protein [Dinothrombium tinctorium]
MFSFNRIKFGLFSTILFIVCVCFIERTTAQSETLPPTRSSTLVDTFTPFDNKNITGFGNVDTTNVETTATFGTLPARNGDVTITTITGKNEFEKSTTTYVPTFFTRKEGEVGSTPLVAAVYEEIPEDETPGGHGMTETSMITNAGTGPIYVTTTDNHHQEICDFCIYEGEGNFTSYGYPLDYRPNLNCSYRVQRLDDSDVCELELIFHDFDVPVTGEKDGEKTKEITDCHEDYLEVYGRKFCGTSWKGKTEIVPFPATQKEVKFIFRSDAEKSGRGFWVEVRRKPGTCYGKKPVHICEERFSDNEFYISSPRFPSEYPSNSECSYYIRKHTNDVCGLELTFLHFDLEAVNGCFYDHLDIGGQKFCGMLQPNTIKIVPFDEDQKVINFHSDNQISKSGFQIHVRQMTQCRVSGKLPPPPSCNVCTSDLSGILVSYNYPNHYRNNLLCTYTVDKKDPNYCRIELRFDDFDILPSVDCTEDYLLVNNKRFCGTTLHSTKQVLDFESNSISLMFKTDAMGTSKGFSIRYNQLPCQIGQEPEPKKEPPLEPGKKHFCDYMFMDKSFFIRSENVSNKYLNNLNCHYLIQKNTSAVCYLEFTFIKFDVEASPQCQFDYLEVNNVRLCGSLQKETTRTYIFDEKEKVVKFHSDPTTTRDGFIIKVDQLECKGDAIIRSSTTALTPDTAPSSSSTTLPYFPSVPSSPSCDQTFIGQEFEITSPQYPNLYALSTDCMYSIQKLNPRVCRLEVTYYDFVIQGPDAHGYCKYDYLDFNGIRMCGEVMKGSIRNYYFPESSFNVRFHSDNLYTPKDRGFRIAIRQAECANGNSKGQEPSFKCDQIFTQSTFELKSPSYPETYPTNINCQYTVVKKTDGAPVCQLEVHFTDFRLDDDVDCQGDHVDFEGKRFCGPQPQKLVKFFPFDRSEFIIKFRSDGTERDQSKRGFFLQIRQRECPDGFSVSPSQPQPKPTPSGQEHQKKMDSCNQMFTDVNFEILSPKYPAMYENNLDCSYVVRRNNPKICRVDLLFVDFDVEDGSECEHDFLAIDGIKLCGRYKANTVRSFVFTGTEKTIVFHTNPARINGGFYIKGQQKECEGSHEMPPAPIPPIAPPSSPQAPSICEICFADTAGEIKSYGYPNNYPNNLYCNYKVTGLPDYCSVYLKFEEFSLEPAKNGQCINDYLEIEGIRYCGSNLKGQRKIIRLSGSPKEISLKFVTNGHTNGRGFLGSYTQFPCTDSDTKHITQSTQSSHPLPGVIAGTGPISVVHPEKSKGFAPLSKTRIPCDLVIFEKSFEIKSPGYPYMYPANSDCLYSVRRTNPEICKIRLEIVEFDIEASLNCVKDYLEFANNKLCGIHNRTTREFDFVNYKFALRFRSDSERNRKGFLIRGLQMECASKQFSPPAVPPVSSSSELAPHYPSYPVDSQIYHTRGRDPSASSIYQAPALPPYVAPRPYAPEPVSISVPAFAPSPAGKPFLPKPGYYGDNAQHPTNIYPSRTPVPIPVPPSLPSFSQSSVPHFSPSSNYYPSGHQTTSASCNRIINDSFFDLKSPQYPFRYKEGTKCMFIIKKSKENVCQLDLMFITFEVGDGSCQRDFVSVDGERLCGALQKEKIQTFKFDLPEKFIYFRGDLGAGLGFHIRGRQVECADPHLHTKEQFSVEKVASEERIFNSLPYCDQQFAESEFKISSPNYPNNYPNNLFCRFTIIRPTTSICALDMKFLNFDLEDDPQCAKDYLEIDNGKICGHLPPNHESRRYSLITSKLNFSFDPVGRYYYFPEEQKKTLLFRTDSLAAKSGFTITIKQITDCSILSWKPGFSKSCFNKASASFIAESLPPPVCDLCNQDIRGHFTSTNYPRNYENYVRCTYRISAHNENYCKVRLHIRDLDIEESSACDKDYLYIQNERICNTNYRPKEMTIYFPQFGAKEIQFSFHSDSRNTGRGFYIEYLQELCSTPQIKPGNGHQYPSSSDTQSRHAADPFTHHSHKARSYAAPQYPPNYVSKAHIEEIVETRVKVLDPQVPVTKVEHRNPEEVKPVTINVQLPSERNNVHNLTRISR